MPRPLSHNTPPPPPAASLHASLQNPTVAKPISPSLVYMLHNLGIAPGSDDPSAEERRAGGLHGGLGLTHQVPALGNET
jgi:hypothetical protein